MVEEIILKGISNKLIASIGKYIKNTNIKSYSKEKDIIDALNLHMLFVNKWSSEINFSDLKQSKSLTKIFIPLDLHCQPIRVRMTQDEVIETIELKKVFNNSNHHTVLLGQVGSGKTTSLKYFCQSLLFNEEFFENKLCYPIVIKLSDFNSLNRDNEFNKSIIFNTLLKILGIKFDFQKLDEVAIENFKELVLIDFLNENNVLVLLDGFDEMAFKNRKEIVLKEFEKLVCSVEKAKIILTSRTSDFRFAFENTDIFEICPLTDDQILLFAQKWLENKQDANDFIIKIKNSPFYDTTIRPLTIAHLCALYERNRNIPEKPKTVYKKIVLLLLEDWNLQRNIHRQSKYSKFENDRKFEFLSSLAWHLTLLNRSNNFNQHDLLGIYREIYQDFDLPLNEMIPVINEIESHNGLIVQSGFQNFEFAHKSIQEYLTAEYIVKLPSIPNSRNIITKLPNEFAVAIAISSQPSEYFVEFIARLLPLNPYPQYIKSFINRLILEKVDFNKGYKVGISALKLYSCYVAGISAASQQLNLFYHDDLIIQFENLVDEIFKRNDRIPLFSKYIIKESVPTAEGDSIYVLQLKKDVREGYPKELYCRKSFFPI